MGGESSMSYVSHSGANVPPSTSFSLSGANVPGSESSTYGTFPLGSERTWERKFQLPSHPMPAIVDKWTRGAARQTYHRPNQPH